MKQLQSHTRRATLCAGAALLAACGGGNGDSSAPPGNPTVTLSGVVADGPLAGAIVCLDLNDNGACDSGEPSSDATDADGHFTLRMAQTDAGMHGLVAAVPATAVDKDTAAPVGTAFVLKAPPVVGTSAFVSPLTTLVVELAASQGLSTSAAETEVKAKLGLTQSPLANFVSTNDTQAATLARTVNTVITEVSKLADAANVPAGDKAALIASVTTANLSTLAALVNAASGTTPAEVAAQVSGSLLAERNLSADTVAAQAAVAQAIAAAPQLSTPGPFVSVRRFTYTDANNHFVQAFVGDSSQLAADGTYGADEVRVSRTAGNAVPFNRNTAYWNKSTGAWKVCDVGWKIIQVTPATATTPQKSSYCKASLSSTRVVETDVAGRRMADVVAGIRASSLRDAPGADTDASGLPIYWGPAPASLGEAVFPDNARFSTREQVSELGDTDRYSLTDGIRVAPRVSGGAYRYAVTTADLKRMPGNFVDTAAAATTANTVQLDDLPTAQTDISLRKVKRYRAAFNPTDNAARFYACDVIDASNATVNCAAVGDGSTVATEQADSSVLRFATGYPAALINGLKRQRHFVERSGAVWGGYRDLERSMFNQRPNTVAWNALRSALAMADLPSAVAPAGPGPFEQVRRWTYADANNYFVRLFTGDDSQVDAQGDYSVTESRTTVATGALVPFARNTLYWTGTEWFNCPNDAAGAFVASSMAPRHRSTYCKAYIDERYNQVSVTLAGRNIADVLRNIRWFSSRDGGFDYANYGANPDVHTALANTTFPAGATLQYRGNSAKSTAVAVFTAPNNQVRVPPADSSAPFDTWPYASSLEEFIAKNPGDLIGNTLNGSTAFFVHSYTLPSAPAPEYTPLVEFRVSFDANGNKARFYRNNRLASNNFTTNYVKLLDTTYRIEMLGDTRVLRFEAMPDGFVSDFVFERMFAQRADTVWYAAKDAVPAAPAYSIRLNGMALRAAEAALGVVR